MKILDIQGLQILDSRGNPTLEVKVLLEDGSSGTFKVPSGASTGIHEAHELRDGREDYYHGKSVEKCIENISIISEAVVGLNLTQTTLDAKMREIDGTPNKENLGANTLLGVSVAFAKASAKFYNLPLYEYLYRLANGVTLTNKTLKTLQPIHLFANVINGGLHAGNKLNVQEFMIVPLEGTVQERIMMISEIYQTLKQEIGHSFGKSQTALGDEGGFAPEIAEVKEALDLLMTAIRQSGYLGRVGLALDTAASDFFDQKKNKYAVEEKKVLDYKQLTDFYNEVITQYPIISIEDPFGEDDFEGFAYFRKHVDKLKIINQVNGKKQVMIVGDDLTVTNPERIKLAIKKKLCNTLLLKVNQIGTLSESLEAHNLAKKAGWKTIVSHRSGETEDSFIADLAVALESSIKIGAPARGERTAKYNRLLEIFN